MTCVCGDMPPGGVWPKGEEPPNGCPVHGPAVPLLPKCIICHQPTGDGNIQTDSGLRPCCNSCFKDMVCP